MTADTQAVPAWVFNLLDAFLDESGYTGFDSGDPGIPLEVIEHMSAYYRRRETFDKRIAAIKERRAAPVPGDIDWLIAELEGRFSPRSGT
jgi:hypothetical protein